MLSNIHVRIIKKIQKKASLVDPSEQKKHNTLSTKLYLVIDTKIQFYNIKPTS